MQKILTGSELKRIRIDLNLTQRQMSALLDVKLHNYVKYEQGKANVPIDVVEKFYYEMGRKRLYNFDVSFDWLKVRFKTLDYKKVIREVLQMSISDFFDSPQTFYGYDDMVTLGTIRVLFSHNEKKSEEGTLIEFTGSACREFESILLKQNRTWQDFIYSCFEFAEENRDNREIEDYLAFTRVDIAVDELYNREEGNIDLIDFANRIKEEKIIVSNVDNITFDEGLRRVKGRFKNSGLTIYLGSRQSDVFIRFYQKDLEQAVLKDVSVDYIREVIGLKNRYEIELHKKRSFQVLSDFANGADLGVIASQILTNYLIVYDWDGYLDIKWQDLVGFFGGYRFVTKPRAIDYSRSKKWVQKSASGLLKTIAFESFVENRNLIGEMVSEAKVNGKYEEIMRRMADDKGLDYEEVLKDVEQYYQSEW